MTSMPQLVGSCARVVDTGDLTIDELAGNVATKDDRISIAHVKISAPTSEPWLTLHYDEWMCVLKGRMVLHFGNDQTLEVKQGQTVFIQKGERFRPVFPDGDTEYVPVCLPAFRPDRCIREDEPDSAVSQKLRELHSPPDTEIAAKKPKMSEEQEPEILYHMCQRSLWDSAKASGEAYFPPTFEKDGFTHATAVPSRLISTANHFYQDVTGEWVCLRFRRSALRRLGIITKDEQAMPVGDKASNQAWTTWVCPHVFGGLPPQVVDAEFPMLRAGTAFTAIAGLTDMPRRVMKLATAEELSSWRASGTIRSEMDKKDGFVHLTTGPQMVLDLFFKGRSDLKLLEIDAERLPGPVDWIVGKVGDAEPSEEARSKAATLVHYLVPEGCVHVYGKAAVPMDLVTQEVPIPLGENGAHVLPPWARG